MYLCQFGAAANDSSAYSIIYHSTGKTTNWHVIVISSRELPEETAEMTGSVARILCNS